MWCGSLALEQLAREDCERFVGGDIQDATSSTSCFLKFPSLFYLLISGRNGHEGQQKTTSAGRGLGVRENINSLG